MKRIIYGYSQEKAISLGLDIKDLILLKYIFDFIKSGALQKEDENGEIFYWIKSSYLIEQLPILYIGNTEALRRRLKKLVDLKLLKYKLLKEGGTFTLYTIGEEYDSLLFNKDDDFSCKKEDDLKVQGGTILESDKSDSKVEPKDSKVNIQKEKDNKKINIKKVCDEVVKFLNREIGTSYKSNSKKTISLIEARINDGFTLDDFKRVILNKKGSWQGTNYEVYLRPSTLFSDSKFEEYLNEKRAKKEEKNKGLYDVYKPFFEED